MIAARAGRAAPHTRPTLGTRLYALVQFWIREDADMGFGVNFLEDAAWRRGIIVPWHVSIKSSKREEGRECVSWDVCVIPMYKPTGLSMSMSKLTLSSMAASVVRCARGVL